MTLVPLLLLQVATFQTYVDEARVKLGLTQPITIHVYEEEVNGPGWDGPLVAWVPYSRPNRINVWNTALQQASNDALKVIAYHETCHHYLRAQELAATTKFQQDLVHELERFCTVRTLGQDFERILRRLKYNSYGDRLGTVLWWRRNRPCR
jgi:hypothetical protein